MVKNKYLAKSINDAGWNLFLNTLLSKAEEVGKEVVEVDPRNTSQLCSECGELVPKKLSVRVHKCSCDYKENRDINAAHNILKRAELRINGSDFDKSRQGLGTDLRGLVSLEAG
ncbi:zinc ribbon domain-containing protein [endosymbiont GvMRE of Glomus versiforme]|uniref:zinc ribbon domain-containing protein n=1 Tax=endosymbiont GvMRE of Glomus versiforme TaxID=2039283 RepID=UPI000EB9077B|nr:zinc ribbon domain-containing protein [endosymbiont GvMRE of Glomus versiforme]RHZ35978.1 Transposase [endosymbiont GvMRE of Glomus versiforme]